MREVGEIGNRIQGLRIHESGKKIQGLPIHESLMRPDKLRA